MSSEVSNSDTAETYCGGMSGKVPLFDAYTPTVFRSIAMALNG